MLKSQICDLFTLVLSTQNNIILTEREGRNLLNKRRAMSLLTVLPVHKYTPVAGVNTQIYARQIVLLPVFYRDYC